MPQASPLYQFLLSGMSRSCQDSQIAILGTFYLALVP